ncbi:MAG: thioredoxin family protein [Methanosarcinales archaeon]|nr:thioredoxin family protein [ANME-2 cluster archaeon]MDF1532808.1 thioredoxin family protein [ANME-2 cluster archaeon]MDW7775937.1 thioredoxin family protein [Methanosarcinales archaeon]
MDKEEGCSCFNAALVDYALKKKKSSLHKATCPVCHRTFTTNRQGDEMVCFDCLKGLRHTVEVLGIGGKQYHDTLNAAEQAVLGSEFRVIPVTDVESIMTYEVTVTPAVVVDGKVMCEGRVPEYDEICEWIGKQNDA